MLNGIAPREELWWLPLKGGPWWCPYRGGPCWTSWGRQWWFFQGGERQRTGQWEWRGHSMIPQVYCPNKHKVPLSPQGIGRRQPSNLEGYAPSETYASMCQFLLSLIVSFNRDQIRMERIIIWENLALNVRFQVWHGFSSDTVDRGDHLS